MIGGHRRVLVQRNGRRRIPGRYAIDWMPAPGGPGVGAPVIAVANATVAATHDGVKEAAAGQPRRRVSVDDEAGNFVVLDLGDGRFAHFQHLAPGLSVRPGQRLRRGDMLGRLGATGHVTRPHLHLHVSDGPGALTSEGMPFAFDQGMVIGGYRSVAAAESGVAWRQSRPRRLGVTGDDLPPPNAVVIF